MSDINLELAIEQVSNQQLQILDLGLDHHRVGHSAGFGQIAGRYQNIDRTAEWFVTDRILDDAITAEQISGIMGAGAAQYMAFVKKQLETIPDTGF